MRSYRRGMLLGRRNLLIASSMLSTCWLQPALAQFTGPTAPATPDRDGLGVDIPSGQLDLRTTDVAIGGDVHALALTRVWRPFDNQSLKPQPTNFAMSLIPDDDGSGLIQVQLPDETINFQLQGGSYIDQSGGGGSISGDTFSSPYGTAPAAVYTSSDGTRYLFAYQSGNDGNNTKIFRISQIRYPDGYSIYVDWVTTAIPAGSSPDLDQYFDRINFVSDSTNHFIRFRYESDDPNGNSPGFNKLVQATAINTSVQKLQRW